MVRGMFFSQAETAMMERRARRAFLVRASVPVISASLGHGKGGGGPVPVREAFTFSLISGKIFFEFQSIEQPFSLIW
ncbi:MAG: hypothetical protein J1E80_03855 [Desulfovibrionaceae bacterium]|nr:hypothetical protein [Desulfovibrionaceae bacterium]